MSTTGCGVDLTQAARGRHFHALSRLELAHVAVQGEV